MARGGWNPSEVEQLIGIATFTDSHGVSTQDRDCVDHSQMPMCCHRPLMHGQQGKRGSRD